MAGNSLGLLPRRAREIVNQELDVWSSRCVGFPSRVATHAATLLTLAALDETALSSVTLTILTAAHGRTLTRLSPPV